MLSRLQTEGSAPTREQLAGVELLEWRTPSASDLDLRGSEVRHVRVTDIVSPLTIVLPAAAEAVTLSGRLSRVSVQGEVGAGASVSLWGDVSEGLPEWIRPAGELEISGPAQLDLSPIREMAHLRSLTVRGVTGRVTGCASLAGTGRLERIAFYGCYDIDTAGFPHHSELPNLEWIMASDVGASDAKVLRERFDGFWNGHVVHPRSRAWVERHLGDPFRTWVDWSPRLGRKASALWREAAAQLKAVDSVADHERILGSFATALDGIAERQPLDTLQREQAGEAVRGLAAQYLPAEHPLRGWMPA
ncbi:MAG: hypothetical protein QM638_22435 [Nocardioides sp.]|uniref:hypothetical protein n=1 Tax=Nocardioides sp. TaxID=35761 RepID=UPI0039E4BADE